MSGQTFAASEMFGSPVLDDATAERLKPMFAGGDDAELEDINGELIMLRSKWEVAQRDGKPNAEISRRISELDMRKRQIADKNHAAPTLPAAPDAQQAEEAAKNHAGESRDTAGKFAPNGGGEETRETREAEYQKRLERDKLKPGDTRDDDLVSVKGPGFTAGEMFAPWEGEPNDANAKVLKVAPMTQAEIDAKSPKYNMDKTSARLPDGSSWVYDKRFGHWACMSK